MSIILKSKIEINRSPINNSVSKQMYSFPKSERFPKLSKNTGRTDKYYSLPNIHSIRYTTLGYGQRSDFTASQKGINSKFYGNYSDFDPNHPHGPKYSFAIGRDKYEKVFIEGSIPNDKNVPGPGKYFIPKPFGYDGIKFSIKGRNEEVKNNKIKKVDYPGPGEYPVTVKINEKGKYIVSNITNVSSLKFGDKKNKRFVYNINKFPGPGKYEMKPLFGKIFDSRYRSNSGITISGRYKIIDSRSNYPGPGSYRLPSDFGQYISKDADKYPSENVYPVKKYPFEEKAWRHGMKIIKHNVSYQENEEIDDNRKVDEKEKENDNIDNNKNDINDDNNQENNNEFYVDKEEQEDEKPGRENVNMENQENEVEESKKEELKQIENEEVGIEKEESKQVDNEEGGIKKEEPIQIENKTEEDKKEELKLLENEDVGNEKDESKKVDNEEGEIKKEESKPIENKTEDDKKEELKLLENEDVGIEKVDNEEGGIEKEENKKEEENEEVKEEENKNKVEGSNNEDNKNEGEFVGYLENDEQDDIKPKDMEQMNVVNDEQNENQGENIQFADNEEEDKVKPDEN